MKKIITRLVGLYFNILVLFSPRTAGRKGFYLFCTPQRPSIKDYHQNFLNTSEKLSFGCNGDMIQYYRWGTGDKVLLFLHGWQSHTFRWKNYIEAFSKEEFTIYAIDAPAHGLSGGKYLNLPIYSTVIERFLDRIPPVHTIVSHSLGSFAALHTFFRHPSLPVKQLVITGTPGEVKDFVKFYRDVLGLSDRTMRAIYMSFEENIQHLPEYYSAARFATGVTIPLLIIHDEHDNETPYHHAVAIHKLVKNSKLITTSGLGHNLRSATVVKHVVDFVTDPSEDKSKTESDFEMIHR